MLKQLLIFIVVAAAHALAIAARVDGIIVDFQSGTSPILTKSACFFVLEPSSDTLEQSDGLSLLQRFSFRFACPARPFPCLFLFVVCSEPYSVLA